MPGFGGTLHWYRRKARRRPEANAGARPRILCPVAAPWGKSDSSITPALLHRPRSRARLASAAQAVDLYPATSIGLPAAGFGRGAQAARQLAPARGRRRPGARSRRVLRRPVRQPVQEGRAGVELLGGDEF